MPILIEATSLSSLQLWLILWHYSWITLPYVEAYNIWYWLESYRVYYVPYLGLEVQYCSWFHILQAVYWQYILHPIVTGRVGTEWMILSILTLVFYIACTILGIIILTCYWSPHKVIEYSTDSISIPLVFIHFILAWYSILFHLELMLLSIMIGLILGIGCCGIILHLYFLGIVLSWTS